MGKNISFGVWVRQRRTELGLTQQDLAYQTGCARVTIQKIESDARRPSPHMAKRLAQSLHLPSTDYRAFLSSARSDTSDTPIMNKATRAHVSTSGWVPHLTTPLIGREDATKTLSEILMRTDVRLLTLTGPPGVGKTSLAIQLATSFQHVFASGVIFVSLTSVNDERILVHTLATTLDIDTSAHPNILDALCMALCERQMLLVLDNFEQLCSASSVLTRLLSHTAHIKFLITSRVRLGTSSEHIFTIPPLSLPSSDQALTEIMHNPPPALQLFITRAQAVNPQFSFDEDNAITIMTICQRLDGLPLALELAAAWSNIFSPQMILNHLDAQILLHPTSSAVLPKDKHVLQAAFDASYQLLGISTQNVLARLSVFSGDWSLEAAWIVTAQTSNEPIAYTDFLGQIQTLVSHSWIQSFMTAEGAMRYRLLATIRSYTANHLYKQHRWDFYYQKHAQYYLQLFEHIDMDKDRATDQAALTIVSQEYTNIRTALEWTLTHEPPMAYELCSILWHYWYLRGHIPEGSYWVERVLTSTYQPTPGTTYACIQRAAGCFAYKQGNYKQAQTYLHMALTIYQQLEDIGGIAATMNTLGSIARLLGNNEQATECFERSLDLFKQLEDTWSVTECLFNLGHLLHDNAEYERAQDMFKQCLSICEDLESQEGCASALLGLGSVARDLKDHQQAKQLLSQCLHMWRELNEPLFLAGALEELGYVEIGMDNLNQAHSYFSESLQIRQAQNDRLGMIWIIEAVAVTKVVCRQYHQAQQLFAIADRFRHDIHTPRPRSEQQRLAPFFHTLKQHHPPNTISSPAPHQTMEQIVTHVFALLSVVDGHAVSAKVTHH